MPSFHWEYYAYSGAAILVGGQGTCPVDAKKANLKPRVLQQQWEDDVSGCLRQNEELVRKVAEDQAQRKRRADLSCVFTGPLRETRRKQDLEDIASALSLSTKGRKRDILERVLKEFEANPELKSDPRFERLFNLRQRKRARIGDVPVAGPSTYER